MRKNIDVLGRTYTIEAKTPEEDSKLYDCDGYCDHSVARIVLRNVLSEKNDPDALADLYAYQRKVVRHEIIHAFLYESGLSMNSWGNNEEIVDWIAIQFPKMYKAFEKLYCAT